MIVGMTCGYCTAWTGCGRHERAADAVERPDRVGRLPKAEGIMRPNLRMRLRALGRDARRAAGALTDLRTCLDKLQARAGKIEERVAMEHMDSLATIVERLDKAKGAVGYSLAYLDEMTAAERALEKRVVAEIREARGR